ELQHDQHDDPPEDQLAHREPAPRAVQSPEQGRDRDRGDERYETCQAHGSRSPVLASKKCSASAGKRSLTLAPRSRWSQSLRVRTVTGPPGLAKISRVSGSTASRTSSVSSRAPASPSPASSTSSGRIPSVTGPSGRPTGQATSPQRKTPPSTTPSSVFMAGRPMNSATKRFDGRR